MDPSVRSNRTNELQMSEKYKKGKEQFWKEQEKN
jgi:hypothetical protein